MWAKRACKGQQRSTSTNPCQFKRLCELCVGANGAQLGQMEKNPPKIRFLRIVKLTHHSNACNELTNFEYEG